MLDTVIASPGIYDLAEDEYHADPVPGGSLSSSGTRRLLATCPAVYRWEREHGALPRRAWDLGTAAHKLVLGVGPTLAVIDAPDYRTKAAQQERDAARAAGAVPLLTKEHDQVQAMAAALRTHPIAGPLLTPGNGDAEQTLIWYDHPTGVWCRARLDWLRRPQTGRPIIADYKTTTDASEEAIARAVASYGYHCQHDWYTTGAAALGLDAGMVFVFQEKQPPYVVTVVELDHDAIRAGRRRNRRAIEIYARCAETGHWPAYAEDHIPLITLPAWATREDSL
ncbi:hypothetical protein HNP84_000201 [Thermocatellispora tengchongensis]|uniref:Putative exodeoxyribonuclease 8 PDDEXK-like domain-containing protein n=1 Tax=Thermocatellispora tengchongensis TaxID=1073253 RepID=A0A840NXU6_9ACTN|nr:PD-(D/E)XK nuclease-like domain-containing protein [Thermocatellispora tengchongensis]MBB5130513.1 hypothetical protein [Thermocatellispora tengchongensis]